MVQFSPVLSDFTQQVKICNPVEGRLQKKAGNLLQTTFLAFSWGLPVKNITSLDLEAEQQQPAGEGV